METLAQRELRWFYESYQAMGHIINIDMSNPLESIVVLSQPRAGSTFLMRLVSNVLINKGVRGDMPIDYLSGLTKAWSAATKTQGQYGHMLLKFEESKIFPDEYRGGHGSHEWWCEWTNYHTRVMLLGGSAGFMKTTQVGFGNDLVEDFVDMLRTLCDTNHHKLRLVFLTRDHEEIANSLMKKWEEEGVQVGHVLKSSGGVKEYIHKCLESQHEQFDEFAKLGDIKMTYERLVADPKALLRRLGLNADSYPETYEKIINNKLR